MMESPTSARFTQSYYKNSRLTQIYWENSQIYCENSRIYCENSRLTRSYCENSRLTRIYCENSRPFRVTTRILGSLGVTARILGSLGVTEENSSLQFRFIIFSKPYHHKLVTLQLIYVSHWDKKLKSTNPMREISQETHKLLHKH